jgi:predicted dehydrogenase
MEKKSNEPITALMLGCGQRGANVYGKYALANPNKLKMVACMTKNPIHRERFSIAHQIPPEYAFSDDDSALSGPKIADAVFICTGDPYHEKEVIMALEKGYHVFLEQPMAITEEGCRKIVEKSDECGKILSVGFVLRYSPIFSKIKEIIDSGLIGTIVNIKHSENMGVWVYAHSFVRGSSYTESPIILQKGSHDFDLICWFAQSRPIMVSSFAQPCVLSEVNAPKGAPLRCTDGCPHSKECIYDAVKFYLYGEPMMKDNARSENRMIRSVFKFGLNHPKMAHTLSQLIPPLKNAHIFPWREWPTNQITEDLSDEGIMRALREGIYGRCVYHVPNPQPSSQVTAIQFENGITATFTLQGMSYRDGREIRIDGTKGTLEAKFYNTGYYIDVHDHLTGSTFHYVLPIERQAGAGGDWRIVDGFIDAIKNNTEPLTNGHDSLYSHLIAFASIRSVETGQIQKIKY